MRFSVITPQPVAPFGASVVSPGGSATPAMSIWHQGISSLTNFFRKAAAVIAMTAYHVYLELGRRRFAAHENRLTGRQWRMMNEVPTVFMIVIVISVIVKY